MGSEAWPSDFRARAAASELRKRVGAVAPDLPMTEEEVEDKYVRLRFPTAGGSEYSFEAYLYDDPPEYQVSACLQHEAEEGEVVYFWYHPLEHYDFDSLEDMFDEFCRILMVVLVNATRVREDSGLLMKGYHLEYEQDGEWKGVTGCAAFRLGGWTFPDFRGQEVLRSWPFGTTEPDG